MERQHAQLYHTLGGYRAGGKVAPVLSVTLGPDVLRDGVGLESGRADETLYRIGSDQLLLAVGQRIDGLDRTWLELVVADGGGAPLSSTMDDL